METVSARVPDDLADRIEEYAEERGISTSEAVRRLLSDGLDDDDLRRQVEELERRVERLERRPPWMDWLPWTR